ncbi:MAG: bifunctional folylpolyglutamate synthase/dihydrofolate synthase, partial [candidate division Zixibacteria bacterium]|nr:bifunctional folylpolyglutamate synthase/dihydrofolate synthase [candidate division Zixibacteria bacterium]
MSKFDQASDRRDRRPRRYRSAERSILSREFFGMKLGLENIRLFLDDLGNPQRDFPSVHVAGTNGKGSSVSILSSILRQAGYRVGVFTSPHLVDFRERIVVDGRMVDREFVIRFVHDWRKVLSARKITFFEQITALAFKYFSARKIDIAIVETGLGGRLDATNVLDPLVSVITNISIDHAHILGDSLKLIAREKGGIIKPGRPVAIAKMPLVAQRVLEKVAERRKSPIIAPLPERKTKRFTNNLALKGEHQRENLKVVLSALANLGRHGFGASESAIQIGVEKVRWRGRFQRIKAPGGATIILDVAHNESGVDSLVSTFQNEYPNKRAHVIVGLVNNKPHKEILAMLSGIAHAIYLTSLPTRRTSAPDDISNLLKDFSGPLHIFAKPKSAVRCAL